jgi:hypothetical protein
MRLQRPRGEGPRMDDAAVRDRATAFADALVAGDVDAAVGFLSDELRRNLGEVLALFPLPVTEAAIESVEHGGSALVVVLRLVGESDEVEVQTRWKDRANGPRIVEASHLSRTARAPEAVEAEGELSPESA